MADVAKISVSQKFKFSYPWDGLSTMHLAACPKDEQFYKQKVKLRNTLTTGLQLMHRKVQ